MQRNKKRKGFTLTELAIVIAVIAILIAVLVPTFTSLINKANESADEQAVKSMNTALAADEATDGTPVNPSDAMEVLKQNGFNVENYVALDSDNTIYWDSSTNRILLYSTSQNAVIYPSDAASAYTDLVASNLPNYWYTLSTAYDTVSDKDSMFESCTTLADMINAFVSSESYDTSKTLQLSTNYELSFTSTSSSSLGSSTSPSLGTSSSAIDLTIDLGENTLTTTTNKQTIMIYGDVTFRNGTIVDNTGRSNQYSVYSPAANSSITLEDVTINSDGAVLYPSNESSQVNVINSTIITTGDYGIGTNSGTGNSNNVIITLKNSTITTSSSDGDACAVMINVPGTLTIDNCVINGQRQGVMVRAGTATITNTTINCTMKESQIASYSSEAMVNRTNYTQKWDQGTEVAMSAVVVGQAGNNGYRANAILTMSNCSLSYNIEDDRTDKDYSEFEISLYMIANHAEGYTTSVTTTNCTLSNKVIKINMAKTAVVLANNETNYSRACDFVTDYTGTVYTEWSTDKWIVSTTTNN